MTRRNWLSALLGGLSAGLLPALPRLRRLVIPALWKPCERWDGARWALAGFPRLRAGDVFRIPTWAFSTATGRPERCLSDAYRLPNGIWAVRTESVA